MRTCRVILITRPGVAVGFGTLSACLDHVGSESLHERFEDLSRETRDLHRAIASLIEELDAVDWYQQRVEATDDEDLRAVLAHNRDEEIEHAMMDLEWIRRHVAKVDEAARTYLFTEGPITEIEKKLKAAAEGGLATESPQARGATAPMAAPGSLVIGSLKSP
jgi:ferritin-like protein